MFKDTDRGVFAQKGGWDQGLQNRKPTPTQTIDRDATNLANFFISAGGGTHNPPPLESLRRDGSGGGGGYGGGGGGGGGSPLSTEDQQELARLQMAQIWLDSSTTDALHGNNMGMYGLDDKDQRNIIDHARKGMGFAGQGKGIALAKLGLADKSAALSHAREKDQLNSESISAGAQHAAGYDRDRGYIDQERSLAEQQNQQDRSAALVAYNTQIADLDNRIRNANTEMERIGLQRQRSEIEKNAKKAGLDLDAKALGIQTKALFAPAATGGMSGRSSGGGGGGGGGGGLGKPDFKDLSRTR
jgi:hypothetical protein